jgi:hypothetical protein
MSVAIAGKFLNYLGKRFDMKEELKLNRSLELMAIIEEEVGEARKELNNIWFNKKDCFIDFTNEVEQIESPLKELLKLLRSDLK